VACDVLAAPGAYHIGRVPDGRYFVLAAGFPVGEGDLVDMLVNKKRLWVGSQSEAVTFEGGRAASRVDMTLRPMTALDPPLLMVPPLLLASWSTNSDSSDGVAARSTDRAVDAGQGPEVSGLKTQRHQRYDSHRRYDHNGDGSNGKKRNIQEDPMVPVYYDGSSD
jgi:hypothetical protein